MTTDKYPDAWKKRFLSSGLPLETLAHEIVKKSGYIDIGGGEFERDGNDFSIDMIFQKQFKKPQLENMHFPNDFYFKIQFFIECKYLKSPKCLAFSAFRGTPFRDVQLNSIDYSGIDYLNQKCKFTETQMREIYITFVFQTIGSSIVEFNKGTILDNEKQPDLLYKARNQISFVILNKFIETIRNKLLFDFGLKKMEKAKSDDLSNMMNQFIIGIPVIITNGSIFGMKQGLSLKDVENSNSFEDIFTEYDYICLVTPPLGHVQKHFHNDILGMKEIIKKYKTNTVSSVSAMVSLLESIPSRFYVVNVNKLHEFIENIEKYILSTFKNIFNK